MISYIDEIDTVEDVKSPKDYIRAKVVFCNELHTDPELFIWIKINIDKESTSYNDINNHAIESALRFIKEIASSNQFDNH